MERECSSEGFLISLDGTLCCAWFGGGWLSGKAWKTVLLSLRTDSASQFEMNSQAFDTLRIHVNAPRCTLLCVIESVMSIANKGRADCIRKSNLKNAKSIAQLEKSQLFNESFQVDCFPLTLNWVSLFSRRALRRTTVNYICNNESRHNWIKDKKLD